MPKLTVRESFKRFPDEEACLTHIMTVRFGMRHTCRACVQEATFHHLENRRAYSCSRCGDHVYRLPDGRHGFRRHPHAAPLWFYAIYLFVVTRHGVSGKELQRQLGVTY